MANYDVTGRLYLNGFVNLEVEGDSRGEAASNAREELLSMIAEFNEKYPGLELEIQEDSGLDVEEVEEDEED